MSEVHGPRPLHPAVIYATRMMMASSDRGFLRSTVSFPTVLAPAMRSPERARIRAAKLAVERETDAASPLRGGRNREAISGGG